MKKLATTFKLFAVISVLMFTACQDDNSDMTQETPVNKVSAADLKKEITSGLKTVPENVQIQINDSKQNLEKYLKNDLQITGITVLGKLSTQKGIQISQDLISDKEQFIAEGNILAPETVKVGKTGTLFSGDQLAETQKGLREAAADQIKTGTDLLEISWNYKGEAFTSLCFYNESGILWDNVFAGLVMMDSRGNSEVSPIDAQAKVSSKWFKEWWTAKWLWGSKRGEIGYQITIYYSGSTVSNVDVSDWGNISLGKAKSESKVTKKTGAYGQCRYALGLCTPTGSLSFNTSNFSVSFSGLGSNIVSNGTKSLYP
ncbi:hypothetical protein [Chryseobacterium vrystaatense]|uniref:Uncharacterized protein n=1 Tax=Chryseobacterium vrystaatense TaxID=307480 RepID=A0A1M5BPE6_9FLAO|nr:hypothetical protein [Chryseobacterium vrystaatense]SHF44408.1 hypothetical protein SAMN02787073_2336 [Chryseobacterium vrystaatense]